MTTAVFEFVDWCPIDFKDFAAFEKDYEMYRGDVVPMDVNDTVVTLACTSST